MFIWTPKALEVLREASAKAETMNHREVHPLHLLWAATGRTGLDALRFGKNDHQQAKLRFQVERDLNKLPVMDQVNSDAWGECASPGFKLQRVLLRAADLSARNSLEGKRGRIGLAELMKALLQDDHRVAGLLRAREEYLTASA